MTNEPRPGRKDWKPKHYDFIHRLANGEKIGAAWKAACNGPGSHASRWCSQHRREIDLYLAEMREEARRLSVLSLAEKRDFLARVVRTPIGQVDEKSDLCQEITDDEDPASGRSKRKIKMPDKLRAIDLDAKLAGELQPETKPVADALTLILDQIRNGYGKK